MPSVSARSVLAGETLALGSWVLFGVALLARVLIALAIALTLWSTAPALFGLIPTTVMSDSMAPGIRAGDVVVARPVPARDVQVGNVVLVSDPDHPGRMRLHRLVATVDGALVLKGDADPKADATPIPAADLQGVAFLRIPFAGLPVLWLRDGEWPATVAIGGALAGLMVLTRADRLPGSGAWSRLIGRSSARRLAVASLGIATVVVGAHAADTDHTYSAFSDVAGNAASSFAAAAHFTCPDRSGFPASSLYYGYDAAAGTLEADRSTSGTEAGTLAGAVTRSGGECASVSLPGAASAYIVSTSAVPAPTTFSVSLWFKTTVKGGKLAGFGNSAAAASTTYDRQLWLTSNGYLALGVQYSGSKYTCVGSTNLADGNWHLVVASVTQTGSGSGSTVAGATWTDDGVAVPQCTAGGPTALVTYTGYWHFGGDSLRTADGWTSVPTSSAFAGQLDETAVWSEALTQADVKQLYAAGH